MDAPEENQFDFVRECSDPNIFLRPVEVLCSLIIIAVLGKYTGLEPKVDYMFAAGMMCFLASVIIVSMRLFDAATGALVSIRGPLLKFEIGLNGFLAFLIFVAFCVGCDLVRQAGASSDDLNAAIAFSFFSIFAWSASTFFAYRALSAGQGDEAFIGEADPSSQDTADLYGNEEKPSGTQYELLETPPPTSTDAW